MEPVLDGLDDQRFACKHVSHNISREKGKHLIKSSCCCRGQLVVVGYINEPNVPGFSIQFLGTWCLIVQRGASRRLSPVRRSATVYPNPRRQRGIHKETQSTPAPPRTATTPGQQPFLDRVVRGGKGLAAEDKPRMTTKHRLPVPGGPTRSRPFGGDRGPVAGSRTPMWSTSCTIVSTMPLSRYLSASRGSSVRPSPPLQPPCRHCRPPPHLSCRHRRGWACPPPPAPPPPPPPPPSPPLPA